MDFIGTRSNLLSYGIAFPGIVIEKNSKAEAAPINIPKQNRWMVGVGGNGLYGFGKASAKGFQFGPQLSYKLNKNWSLHADVMFSYQWSKGYTSLESGSVTYDFGSFDINEEFVPTSISELSVPLYVGRHKGPHTIYGGLNLDYLLKVYGELTTNQTTVGSIPLNVGGTQVASLSTNELDLIKGEDFKKYYDNLNPKLMVGYDFSAGDKVAVGLRGFYRLKSNNGTAVANRFSDASAPEMMLTSNENVESLDPLLTSGRVQLALSLKYRLTN